MQNDSPVDWSLRLTSRNAGGLRTFVSFFKKGGGQIFLRGIAFHDEFYNKEYDERNNDEIDNSTDKITNQEFYRTDLKDRCFPVSSRDVRTAIIGMMISLTIAVTILPAAAPMMTATARPMTW